MANSADPDQMASEAIWSGFTLFVKAGHMQVQQDQGYEVSKCTKINLFEIEVKYCKEISCQKIRVTNKRTMMVLYRSPEQTALHTYCWSFSQVHCSKIFV